MGYTSFQLFSGRGRSELGFDGGHAFSGAPDERLQGGTRRRRIGRGEARGADGRHGVSGDAGELGLSHESAGKAVVLAAKAVEDCALARGALQGAEVGEVQALVLTGF